MRLILSVLMMISLTAQAQEAQAAGKLCGICIRYDQIIKSGDVDRAAGEINTFHFNKDLELRPKEAEAVTRLAAHFIGLDEAFEIAQIYYEIYRRNKALMEPALKKLSPADQAKLQQAMKEVERLKKGNG